MKNSYFFIVLIFFVSKSTAQTCTSCPTDCSSGCTVTVSSNSSTDYTIGAGEKLCITGGTYTGDIVFTAASGSICVSGTAAFNPASLDCGLGDVITIQIASGASATFGAISLGSSRNLVIHNCGNVTHTGNMTRTGSGTFKYYNSGTVNYGSNTFNFTGTSGANEFCNSGQVTGGAFEFQGTFTNYPSGTITLTSLTSSGSGDVLNNDGVITVSGTTTMSGGGTMNICNGGRITTNNLDLSGSSKIACSGTCGQMQVSGTSSFTGTSGATGNVDICDASGTAPTRLGTSADPKVDSNSGTTVFAGTVGYCACAYVLPIELTNFTADCKTERIDLNWTTATETNNDYFTIERADDLMSYNAIGIVDSKAANGNSVQPLFYSFTDYSIPMEEGYDKIFYYRLKQTDFNGQHTYSFVQPAGCSSYCVKEIIVINEDNNIYLQTNSICSAVLNLSIVNALGQIVSMKQEHVTAGINRIQLNANDIASGVYVLRANTINQNFSRKFCRQ